MRIPSQKVTISVGITPTPHCTNCGVINISRMDGMCVEQGTQEAVGQYG